MRTITNMAGAATLCLSLSLFFSCKKEAVTTANQQTVLSDKSAGGNKISLVGDTTILTMQPGADDGQDSYVSVLDGSPDYATSNFNFDPELVISTWTVNGAFLRQRSYIKFPELSSIPANATIVSAELSLYGLDPNTSLSAPQGNSIYPGSPYLRYRDNGCYVLAVVEKDWAEDTLTWRNKANYGVRTATLIERSTSQWNYDATSNVTRLVKQMVKDQFNYGFCIRLKDENTYRSILFSSSEASDPAKHPKLVVKYLL